MTVEACGGELVARVARGERDAFEALYRHLLGPVGAAVRRVLRDRAQSEEVVQEVFLELWRTADRYRPDRGSVHAWALTAAHHRAVDRVRAARAGAERERTAALREYRPAYDSVATEAERRLEGRAVRAALAALAPAQREALALAYWGGCTQTRIAALLDTPLGTVKSRVRDGLRRLRTELEPQPQPEPRPA
ncbi:sigma-70 family RNA polymerase sigma factor [Kitasatospora sp. SolWspMP-SS2h]|uniref:sigma-70 family RNA polymerase sigma factor n=1 Tax=Kitasatospora sp. SolWspMP-SS2h TaxID=1305729 RepID=UPI000DBA5771|nr:sigma-70 family RNA polymerase sigma factor [Kitasatospora sp. SolWspMP-SS2h]